MLAARRGIRQWALTPQVPIEDALRGSTLEERCTTRPEPPLSGRSAVAQRSLSCRSAVAHLPPRMQSGQAHARGGRSRVPHDSVKRWKDLSRR